MGIARRYPLSLGARVNHREMARIDAAATLRGINRSDYVRLATFRLVDADLHDAAQGHELDKAAPRAEP